jgi:S1-C subfamily serine protease
MLALISSSPRARTTLALTTVGGALISFAFLTSRPAPASTDVPPQVSPAEAALRVSVMIEGDSIYGSGILIDPHRGLVLTSHHVVQDMHTIHLTGYTGRTSVGTVLASDTQRDLALVQAPGLVFPEMPPPRLGDASRLRPGDEVFAVGMPRKLAFTVSRGIVSYATRELEGTPFLQVDMNINDGNSGGPVVDSSGEVVGVMSFIYRHAQGLSFAVPTSEVAAAFPTAMPPLPPKL